MFSIISKQTLSPVIHQIEIKAPDIAKKAKPGQFVVIRIDDKGERIPLTISDRDISGGTIKIIFQEIGKTTRAMGKLKAGDNLSDLLGPLGQPTHIELRGTVVVVSGGVGTAEILPIAKALKQAGNTVIGIIGARTKELIILENEMRSTCDRLFVNTDDGSSGSKGFVTDSLSKLIADKISISLVYAVGPVPMMRAVASLTAVTKIETLVSLNPLMVDATGMCGACRVTIGGEVKFACVDGPEFDAHKVDWNELVMRLGMFKREENISIDRYMKKCSHEHGSSCQNGCSHGNKK